MAGKLMSATMCLYSDNTFTNQIAAIPIVVGIAVGSTASMSATNITGNYSTYSDRVSDVSALGGTYIYPSADLPSEDKYRPNMYLPACVPKVDASYDYNAYYRIVFKDGKYMSPGNAKISTLSGTMRLYDKYGTEMGSIGTIFWRAYNDTSSYPTETPNNNRYRTLVVSAMEEDGTIPSTASLAVYEIYPTHPSGSTLRVMGMIRKDGTVGVNVSSFFNSIPALSKDPYQEIDPAGPGGGGGTGDFTSTDDVDFPGNPGTSAVNTGFVSLWSPTEQQMLNLSSYMWNADILTIDFWKRLWADPLDVIYGLNIIPVDLRATGRSIIGGTESVVVGLVNTGVQMDYLVEQWLEVDCGSLSLSEVWGAYLDYDPYTKLEIYLPYCGIHPLRVDDFMRGTISLKYKIDLLSGACVAMIKAEKPNDSDNDLSSVVYQFMGNCATQVPVTASQYADAVRSVISLAASVGTMVATGIGGAAATGATAAASKAALAERTIHNSAAVVENVMGIKPGIERSGAIGASAGLLGVQTPYLIITRPRQAHPTDQSKFTGYPSFITETLSTLEGWTIIKDIHLENIPCTADELTEIDGLLKSGVIF